MPKQIRGVLREGVAEVGNILGAIRSSVREAVGYGLELETTYHSREIRIMASGLNQALMIVFRVDEGNVEASLMDEFGQLHHRGNVPLQRVWDEHHVGLALLISRYFHFQGFLVIALNTTAESGRDKRAGTPTVFVLKVENFHLRDHRCIHLV